MSNWYGSIGPRRRAPRLATVIGVSSRSSKRGLAFTGASGKRARMVAAGMGLRNRAPRAAIKGAIAPYGGQRELKYVDQGAGTYAVDTTGTVTCLNLLAVGDDNTTRDGRQVTIKSVQLRGMLSPVDAATNDNLARVIFVWDNANNSGAIATIAQILTASTSTAFPLVDNANRFTILSDQSFAMGSFNNTATQAVAGSPSVQTISLYKKINQVTQYSGTTAAIGSIQNGALLMVTIGSQAAGLGSVLTANIRVRFTDN